MPGPLERVGGSFGADMDTEGSLALYNQSAVFFRTLLDFEFLRNGQMPVYMCPWRAVLLPQLRLFAPRSFFALEPKSQEFALHFPRATSALSWIVRPLHFAYAYVLLPPHTVTDTADTEQHANLHRAFVREIGLIALGAPKTRQLLDCTASDVSVHVLPADAKDQLPFSSVFHHFE